VPSSARGINQAVTQAVRHFGQAQKPPRQRGHRHLPARRVQHYHRTGVNQPVQPFPVRAPERRRAHETPLSRTVATPTTAAAEVAGCPGPPRSPDTVKSELRGQKAWAFWCSRSAQLSPRIPTALQATTSGQPASCGGRGAAVSLGLVSGLWGQAQSSSSPSVRHGVRHDINWNYRAIEAGRIPAVQNFRTATDRLGETQPSDG
jgi:hypothetical protein